MTYERLHRPENITAPMSDNETWAECLNCRRTWKAVARPGIIHLYVEMCASCREIAVKKAEASVDPNAKRS